MCIYDVYPKIYHEKSFSENICNLSPSFVSMYNQALFAETNDNTVDLAGMGYRKSLEFLIKDYLINIKNYDKESIISLDLGKCIDKLDNKMKDIARASAWLGNDEVHYFRKHKEYSIKDLKIFIEYLVNIIDGYFIEQKAKDLIKSNK